MIRVKVEYKNRYDKHRAEVAGKAAVEMFNDYFVDTKATWQVVPIQQCSENTAAFTVICDLYVDKLTEGQLELLFEQLMVVVNNDVVEIGELYDCLLHPQFALCGSGVGE